MVKNEWDAITKEEVIRAIEEYNNSNKKVMAKTTFLLYNGQRLPGKGIRGIAYKIHYNKTIDKSEYYGGLETVEFFNNLGFTMEYQGKIVDGKVDDGYMWMDFYVELADKLLDYKNNRSELLDKVLGLWDNIDMEMPTLELNNEVEDMDPFTIFALFNKQILDSNRVKIMEYFKKEFNIKASIPHKFYGSCVVNNMRTTFYYFKDEREEDDIDNLWNLFEVAIEYAEDNNEDIRRKFTQIYNDVLTQKGIRWNITMGLSWIRPYEYIGLDSNMRKYLQSMDNNELSNKSLKNPPQAVKYLEICELCKELSSDDKYEFNNLPELGHVAYMILTNNSVDESDTMGDSRIERHKYWLYSPAPNANKWDEFYDEGIMAIGWEEIGDLRKYENRDDIVVKLQEIHGTNSKYSNNSLALWQFANEIQQGDVIFVKKGTKEILGYGVVTSDYYYDNTRKDYHHTRKVNWKVKGHWKYNEKLNTKTLTNITDYSEIIETISNFFENAPLDEEPVTYYETYTKNDFLTEAYITEKEYDTLRGLLEYKKNIILQGPPGVGKTFLSKRLAYSILGSKDKEKVEFIQFHQSYSYEEFIMGYRPTETGFELKNGVFYNFCKKAENDLENKYFFIIDEINRGNLNKIFGELFMLIEKDKRGNKINLLYNKEKFTIPKNLYIIGLMNTADRSLAMMDYALRRRFAFYTLQPAFESENFIEYANNLNDSRFNETIKLIKELNKEIKDDDSFGKGFMIGHSYFTGLEKENNIKTKLDNIICYEIIPLINEYWFDQKDDFNTWKEKLKNVIR